MSGIVDALDIHTFGSVGKMIMFDEALPTALASFLLFAPMSFYNRVKDKPYVTTGYILYFIIVFLVFMMITHPRYVIEYQAYEVWIFHNLACLTIIVWNIANMLIKRFDVY